MTEELQRGLGRVEGKLDLLLDVMTRHTEDDEKNFAAIRSDVATLKVKAARHSGFGAAVGSGVTILLALATAWLKGH